MQIPSALFKDIEWPELSKLMKAQARIKAQRRELGAKLAGLERDEKALQELFVRQASELYESMSTEEITSEKDLIVQRIGKYEK